MADPAHADRSHATWSASASERLWNCPGSLALSKDAPPDKESHAAAWGTCAHEVAEWCLRAGPEERGGSAVNYIGKVVSTKSHKIMVCEEVAETAQEYVDYVRHQSKGAELLIEQRFSLGALDPPFDAGGTGDAVILKPEEGLIEIVDLKGGRGFVVEATGNKQLRTYALGALLANPGPWVTVRSTIVQPRAPHRDGRIRSEEYHVTDLLDWTQDLMVAMERASEAQVNLARSDLDRKAWVRDYLEAGDHCVFCRAAPTCPALAAKSLEVAQTHFSPQGALTLPPAPETLSMDQVVRVLDHADMISGWINAVRAYAQDQAEMGLEVASGSSEYVLTEKRGRRAWKEEDEAAIAKALSKATGEGVTEFYAEPKLLSPAQAEKVLGSKRKAEIKDLWESRSSGFNLSRKDKTTRAAVVAPAKQFFQPE